MRQLRDERLPSIKVINEHLVISNLPQEVSRTNCWATLGIHRLKNIDCFDARKIFMLVELVFESMIFKKDNIKLLKFINGHNAHNFYSEALTIFFVLVFYFYILGIDQNFHHLKSPQQA